jgi:hypothetical protein
MKNRFIYCALVGVLLVLSSGCRHSEDSADHDDTFSGQAPPLMQASDLKQTVVVATLDAPIAPGTNVLWCGTFQLVWNEVCGLVGEDIHFTNDPAMVAELNKKAFTSNDLDPASYVAVAGFVKDDIHAKIRKALFDKFGNSAKPALVPDESLTPHPDDIVAYTYLFKNLEFAVPFERLERGLNFGGREVAAFGMTGDKSAHKKMAAQILILYQREYNDFVIELKTKSAQDRLILAKIQPGKTLGETIQMVEALILSGRPLKIGPEYEFAVPKFNFDIARTYNEIENANLDVKNPAVKPGTSVVSAQQDIRFQLDEKGVRLKSEAHLAAAGVDMLYLAFDKPFLVMLRRADAKSPYFAMWVDNPELLVPR